METVAPRSAADDEDAPWSADDDEDDYVSISIFDSDDVVSPAAWSSTPTTWWLCQPHDRDPKTDLPHPPLSPRINALLRCWWCAAGLTVGAVASRSAHCCRVNTKSRNAGRYNDLDGCGYPGR